MEKEYEALKEFWNEVFNVGKPEKVDEKWISDETYNEVLKTYVKENYKVLDYGTGDGWGIFEINNTIKNIKGVAIDQSINGINYAKECAKISNFNNIDFVCGSEEVLNRYPNYFDVAFSINVVDVVPDNVIHSILKMLKYSLKKNGILIIGINPAFPNEFLTSIGYIIKDGYLYKNDILRGNTKKIEEWVKLFSNYFEVVAIKSFSLTEKEKTYPRRMFILKST